MIPFPQLSMKINNSIQSCADQSKSSQAVNFYLNQEFTKWNKIDVKGPMTLEQMKNHFEKTYNIEVSMITFGSATVYSSYGADAKKRLPMLVE